jgi:hypothetical protein
VNTLPTAVPSPKEHDEVLKRMIPYLRRHLRSMYARSLTSGLTEYTFAAMLLDNIVLDDYRSQYENTLNQQAPPVEPRGRRRKIRDLAIRAKISARDPAVIQGVMEES